MSGGTQTTAIPIMPRTTQVYSLDIGNLAYVSPYHPPVSCSRRWNSVSNENFDVPEVTSAASGYWKTLIIFLFCLIGTSSVQITGRQNKCFPTRSEINSFVRIIKENTKIRLQNTCKAGSLLDFFNSPTTTQDLNS